MNYRETLGLEGEKKGETRGGGMRNGGWGGDSRPETLSEGGGCPPGQRGAAIIQFTVR